MTTLRELKDRLVGLQVPEGTYFIVGIDQRGQPPEKGTSAGELVVAPGSDGTVSVYSYERGVARNPQHFPDEDAASGYVLEQLTPQPGQPVQLTPEQAAEGRRLARQSVEEFNRLIEAAGGTPAPLPPE
jgi:hypothetical protein